LFMASRIRIIILLDDFRLALLSRSFSD
jgi:hypothetical protein